MDCLPIVSSSPLKQPLPDSVLNFRHSIAQLFRHSLTLESFDGVRVSGSGHDNESDYCNVAASFFKAVVETCREPVRRKV